MSFRAFRRKLSAVAQSLERSPTDQEIGLGDEAVGLDEPTHFLRPRRFVGRQQVGAKLALVLEDVVEVFLLKPPEQGAGKDVVAEIVQVEADLKIDQVRSAVVALKNVLRLVGVDVGDFSAVQFLQELREVIEKRIGDGALF